MLNNNQFSHYLNILLSPWQGERQKIDVLQDLFFLLLKGEHLHPDQWEKLTFILVEIISSSGDDTLRRWAYQVGTLSFGNNKPLVEFCIGNVDKESNIENRSWIAAILSRNLPENQFYDVLNKSEHNLTNENILLSTYLFSKTNIVNFKDILKDSDPLSLIWLAYIGAYKSIAERNKQKPFVTSTELSILTAETDNDEVLKHVMYAFYLQETFSITDLLFHIEDYHKMGNQQKKWYFTLIWKDNNFLTSNIDYFRELLSDRHLFHEINEEVRIGLARGLENSKYTPDISRQLLDWYSHEDTPSTLYYLLKYFQKHQDRLKEYKEIVEYQKQYGDNHLKELVLLNDQEPISNTNSLLIDCFKGSERELIQTLENNMCGGITVVKIEKISANQVQVNEFNGDNANAIMKNSAEPKYEVIKSDDTKVIQHNSSSLNVFLFITANEHERAAFKKKFICHEEKYILGKRYYLGTFGQYDAAYIHIDEQGVTNPAATLLVSELVRELQPVAVVMVGIAFGVGEEDKKQKIGDVLVSDKIQSYDSRKELEKETIYKDIPKEVGFQLLNAFREYREWKYDLPDSEQSKVHIGTLLTGSALINSYDYRTKLLEVFSRYKPIGGEMESQGIYSMCRIHNISEWIIVKGICDWAYNKNTPDKEKDQEVAAHAAVDYCFHVFSRDGVFSDMIIRETRHASMRNEFSGYSDRAIQEDLSEPDIAHTPTKSIDSELIRYIEQASKLRNNMYFFGSRYNLGSLYVDVNIYKNIEIEKKTEKVNQTPNDILESQTSALIIGQAGSGKTSFLNYLFLLSAKHEEVINTIPIFISLLEFEKNFVSGLSMKQFIAQLPEFNDINIDALFALDTTYVFFLDGLDEVDNNSILLAEIESFVSNCRNVHFIFSSRAIDKNIVFNGMALERYYIEKFNEDQQKALLKKITATIYPDIDFELLHKKVSDSQKSDKHISEILTNPLYLSMMVMVYKDDIRVKGKDVKVVINKLELFERSAKLIINTDLLNHRNELVNHLLPMIDILLGRVAFTLYDIPYASTYQLKPDIESFIAFRLSCSDEDASSLTELFFNFVEKRSIYINGRFFHESFREYFTALYLYRTLYVSKNTPFGKKIVLSDKDSLISMVNLLLKNDNSQNVIENLLCLIDFNSRNDDEAIRFTFEIILENLSDVGLTFNILIKSTERFLYYRELGWYILLTKMLNLVCDLQSSPFSELYPCVSKYALTSCFHKVYESIKVQYANNVNKLLIVEICYLLYEYICLENENVYSKLFDSFIKIDISIIWTILRSWGNNEKHSVYYLVSIFNNESGLWNGFMPDFILYCEGDALEGVFEVAGEAIDYYFELAEKHDTEIPIASCFEEIRSKWKGYDISAYIISTDEKILFYCTPTMLEKLFKLLREVNSILHLTDSKFVESSLEKGTFLSFCGEYKDAIIAISEGIDMNSSNLVTLYNKRGMIYEILEKYEKAICDYTEVIKIDPNSANHYDKRIRVYRMLKEYDKAVLDYTEIIRLDLSTANHYRKRAELYEIIEKYEEAIADYTEAINLEPNSSNYYEDRGKLYFKIQKYEEAVADYTKAIEVASNKFYAYNSRGILYVDLKEYENAIADFTQAIQIKPDDSIVFYNRAYVYTLTKEYDNAVLDYTEAIKLNPQSDKAYYNRGSVYEKMDEFEKALLDYKKAIDINPDYSNANDRFMKLCKKTGKHY